MNIIILLLFISLNILAFLFLKEKTDKWKILLFFSLIFYGVIAEWAILITLFLSVQFYFSGKIIENGAKTIIYYLIIFLCLVPLLIEKVYISFYEIDLNHFTLIGVSYFTFNGLSYLFDIRKGYIKSEKNFAMLLTFLLFFPYIIAGPLHRYKKTRLQFLQNLGLSNENFSLGFRLVLWGLAKKLILAQRLQFLVDSIIDFPSTYKGVTVILGGIIFFFYLYTDFSSYIDMAQGTAQIFGFKLNQNFKNRVYASTSRKQFWEGWHMTLNHWFRDYFFYPISRKLKSKWQINTAILMTFLLIGIWHEVSLRFFIWGGLNGIWILIENHFRKYFSGFMGGVFRFLGVIYHISIASFLAIIFRTKNLKASIEALFEPMSFEAFNDGVIIKQLIIVIPIFLLMDYFYKKAGEKQISEYIGSFSQNKRWFIYAIITLMIIFLNLPKQDNPYYLQF